MSLGSEVWIYSEKKGWRGPFKVLGIADADIIVDMENGLVNFRNMQVRPYNHQTKENDISYLETANSLMAIPVNKPANKEIPTLLDYPEPQRPR